MEFNRSVLSLFCGAGGLDSGFERAGFLPRLALDADLAAVTSYRRNHPSTRVEQRDVAVLTIEELVQLWNEVSEQPPAGVLGGPPCQTFSVGNRSVRPDDPRRKLPECYALLLKGLNEAYELDFFVFENVAGLQSETHRPDYEAFLERCLDAGFRLFEGILDAQFFGVAQRRPRLLVVGVNRERFPVTPFQFPEPPLLVGRRTVAMELQGLPEPAYFRRGLDPNQIPLHPNHWTMVPRSPKFLDPNQRLNWSRGRSFRVLRWDAPSWTVAYGHREVHIHPEGHRRLSVYEALRLQGFPDSYVLEGTLSDQFRLVGDAVPPPLASALANAVHAYLSGEALRTPSSAVNNDYN